MNAKHLELAQRDIEAEPPARETTAEIYRKFMAEADPGRKGDAGKELIRSIFGTDAITQD